MLAQREREREKKMAKICLHNVFLITAIIIRSQNQKKIMMTWRLTV
jgi:hypothetical protein